MAVSWNGDEVEWYERLQINPLFEELRLGSRDVPKDICEIRGDLFAWNDRDKVLLTTNLKRVAADPDEKQVYQQLNCTRCPDGCVLRLIPEPNGIHVALQCERELFVVRLFRLRGKQGEFGGGDKTITCKVTKIAAKYFEIYGDQFTLVHAAWHLTVPAVLVLLTSDNVLRLFNIASPNDPLAEIPLLSTTTVGVYFKSHGYTLDYPFVSFSLWKNSAFTIRDSGEVYLVPLTSTPLPLATPPSPLLMHPQADDNYPGDPTSLLALPTVPCVLVIANNSGVLHHCVYLEPEEEELEEIESHSSQMLYVLESIQIECKQTETTKLLLKPDPVEKHTYYVTHPSGVHKVTLPWLANLETFATTDLFDMIPDAESVVTHLIDTTVEGLVVLNEPLLGHVVMVTTSDGEMLAMPLEFGKETPQIVPEPATPTLPHRPRGLGDQQSELSRFEKRTRDILHPPGEETAPVIRSSVGSGDVSQEECYRFLVTATKQVNRQALLRHREALEAITQNIARLVRQREYLISSIARLEEVTGEVKETGREMEERLMKLAKQQKELMVRVQRVVFRVESQSPVISEAENCMMVELEGFNNHMDGRMKLRLKDAREKLKLCKDASSSSSVNLSDQQSGTILKTLTESGEYIRNLMKQVQNLHEATPT